MSGYSSDKQHRKERFLNKKTTLTLLLAGVMAGMVGQANAQVLFASTSNRAGDTNNYYQFVNQPGNGLFRTTIGGAVAQFIPQSFTFNIFVPQFPTPVRSLMAFSLTSNGACSTAGTQTQEPLSGGLLSITVDPTDPTYGGTYGGQTLLSANFASSGISQDTGSANPNPAFGAASPVDSVVFTSPWVTLAQPERLTFSYSAGGNLTCGPNSELNTVLLGGNGNFSAQTAIGTPEPGAVGMLMGTGVTASLFFWRRRRA
jgi:hypothetical protein